MCRILTAPEPETSTVAAATYQQIEWDGRQNGSVRGCGLHGSARVRNAARVAGKVWWPRVGIIDDEQVAVAHGGGVTEHRSGRRDRRCRSGTVVARPDILYADRRGRQTAASIRSVAGGPERGCP